MRASMWTREQEEELAELYQQYQEEDGNHIMIQSTIAYAVWLQIFVSNIFVNYTEITKIFATKIFLQHP